MIRVFKRKSRTEKHKAFSILSLNRYRCIRSLQRFPRMFSTLAVMHARLHEQMSQHSRKRYLRLPVSTIEKCLLILLPHHLTENCGETVIINLQRILSNASSLSTTNFCLSDSGLRPSPEAAILS